MQPAQACARARLNSATETDGLYVRGEVRYPVPGKEDVMSIESFQIAAQALIRNLARAIPQGDAALFAGAGLSLNAEYADPDSVAKFERWGSLIERA